MHISWPREGIQQVSESASYRTVTLRMNFKDGKAVSSPHLLNTMQLLSVLSNTEAKLFNGFKMWKICLECKMFLTIVIDFSIGLQSNEYPTDQKSFSASPRKNARSLFCQDCSFWCRACKYKLCFFSGSIRILRHHHIWETRICWWFKVMHVSVLYFNFCCQKSWGECDWCGVGNSGSYVVLTLFFSKPWNFITLFTESFIVGFKQYLFKNSSV